MNKPYENQMPSGVDSFVEESSKEEVKAPEKPMQQKFTSKDYGNVRVYPNETGSNMDKNNKWIGKRYSLMEAHNLNDDYLKNNLVGKTKSGADIYKMPDGYFSGNPRINDASFKNVHDLEDFEKKSGEHRASMKEGTYLDDYIKNYNQPKPFANTVPSEKQIDAMRKQEERAKLDKRYPESGDSEAHKEIMGVIDKETSDKSQNDRSSKIKVTLDDGETSITLSSEMKKYFDEHPDEWEDLTNSIDYGENIEVSGKGSDWYIGEEEEDFDEDEKPILNEHTLLDKFNDAHLYQSKGRYYLTLSNGEIKSFDNKNDAIDYLSKYSNKDYSWAKGDIGDVVEADESNPDLTLRKAAHQYKQDYKTLKDMYNIGIEQNMNIKDLLEDIVGMAYSSFMKDVYRENYGNLEEELKK